jgi:ATP-dependent DNA ligase
MKPPYNTSLMELDSLPRREAAFLEPMECLAVVNVPEGADWIYEIKLDGYRAIAVNSQGKVSTSGLVCTTSRF